eukprot:CAMPEP_0114460194 /NCGR_PEP_ID=MMETSP0104-20121206/5617_1 /TAXON_ID=37642 ORGANISM="Paraphysomonas imperforata, Strain PA2" /NCGR_SAMPLE_ID=MMETSP0104 /ASSEMBLY_ACC=CAM_ASM_000202 /LENGTH=66 /DNA_ID=CAMNT_0001632893 /DNA_START=190 /DNA_END=390 /DNA_ORIENTATION=-
MPMASACLKSGISPAAESTTGMPKLNPSPDRVKPMTANTITSWNTEGASTDKPKPPAPNPPPHFSN